MLTLACVNVGNYQGRGEEYVKILRDMVMRNLARPFRFVCLTDEPINGIECIEAPPDLKGWWAKLYLFEVLKGDVIYFDLDTVITGPLEFLADCDAEFAILRDFYRWDGLQSAVMRWRGDHSYIWKMWVEAGRPKPDGGDQEWIEQIRIPDPETKRLQDLYPEQICSYKRDAISWIPSVNTSIVCFHGEPRPHEVLDRWVPQVWKIGGLGQPRWVRGLNTPLEVMLKQMEENLRRETKLFRQMEPHRGEAILVGGGPSLVDELPYLRKRHDRGGHIFALNGSYAWLEERGIRPEFHVLLDARPENIQFLRPHQKTTYLVASQCHPSIFDALEGYDVVQWVGYHPDAESLCDKVQKPLTIVGGGNTVGLKAMCITALWGYRKLHLFGFDSAYRLTHHAYPQALNDGEATLEIICANRKFLCARWMAKQASDFQMFLPLLLEMGCNITVHGDGLISWIVDNWEPSREVA